MPQRSEPMFVVGLAEGGTPPQHQPIASPAPALARTAPTTSTMNYQTPQERDAALLRELTTSTVNKAILALNANNPTEAAAVLRTALSFADRLATAHNALAVVNARKTNKFHGYSINDPWAGVEPTRHVGAYDLNNP